MTSNISKLLALVCLTGCLITGCNISDLPDSNSNFYLPNYEGEIALIFGRDTLTVGDFIKELSDDSTVVQETPDAELYIVYEDSSEYTAADDFIDVNTFSNEKSVESPVAYPFIPFLDTSLIINREINFEYVSKNGERIDSLFYSSGSLALSITSDFPGDVSYTINTNSFEDTNSGSGVTLDGILNYSGFTPINNFNSTDLTGYKTTLSFQNDSSVFKVNLQAVISIQSGTPLTGNETIFIEADVVDPTFDAIYGNFGRDTFDIESQEIDLDIFSDFSDQGLSFEAPSISFIFENSFGLTAGLDFSDITATYTDKPDLPLTGSFANNIQIINASLDGQGTETVLVMNNVNSNIGDILSSSPSKLKLALVGISNPNDETENFLLGDSKIKVKSKVELPLSLKLDAFEYESEFDLGDISQLDQSEAITLILRTTNELPINGELDLHFLDINGDPIDSILNVSILESPVNFDSNGKTAEAAFLETRITLDAEKIESLTNSENLRLTVRFNSYGLQQDEFVKIFSDYTLITTIAVEGKVSINLNE
ncbi:MAG: hypothetical protein ACFHWX_10310 [Bacteroidota bacterium]